MTVEDCRSLDANRWMREAILKPCVCQKRELVLVSRRASKAKVIASISYEANCDSPPWVRLSYSVKGDNTAIDYEVRLTMTRPRFGGVRWWFVVPTTSPTRVARTATSQTDSWAD